MRKSKNRYFYHIFVSLGDAPGGNDAKCCTDGKRIQCLQIVPQNVPIHLQQFPSYSNRKCKRAVFTYRSPHFWFAWRRPSRNISHGRKDNWMLAKRLAACTYLSSIVSELSAKNCYFYHIFCFPWGRPWGNHAKCYMDGKRIRTDGHGWQHIPRLCKRIAR